MSLIVTVKKSPDVVPDLVKEIEELRKVLPEATARKLRELIEAQLRKRFSRVMIDPDVAKRLPCFRNLPKLLESYLECIRVEVDDKGYASVVIDRGDLVRRHLPRNLPEILEYGDPIGIPVMAHMRTAWFELTHDCTKELVNESF